MCILSFRRNIAFVESLPTRPRRKRQTGTYNILYVFISSFTNVTRCTLMLTSLLKYRRLAASGISEQLCLKQKTGLNNPSCTANDVRIGKLEIVGESISCTPGEQITVTMKGTVESGPDRYAIGFWINEAGGSALDDPDGTCYRDYLNPVDASPLNDQCNQDSGPYFDADNDLCGDVYAKNTDPCGNKVTGPCTGSGCGTCLFTFYTFTLTITCTDINGDGNADVGTCTSWDNNARTTLDPCQNALDTDPGTGSKCSCGFVEIGGISVPAELTNAPTSLPSKSPSATPTASPTAVPTRSPSASPSDHPTVAATTSPSTSPTVRPSASPSDHPTVAPTNYPSGSPSSSPSKSPSTGPTEVNCETCFV